MYDMRSVAPTVCAALGLRPPCSAGAPCIPEVVDTLGQTDKLAVVVIDAFGVSTWEKARDRTPTLNELGAVPGTIIDSVMKTITPVNFATMLTGASPATHGITSREMPLRHETVFHVMRSNGMVSGTAARALSTLGILVSPHADRPGIAASNEDEEVTAIASKRLGEEVNLLWVQLLDVDDAGHSHGPHSPESRDAAARADSNLRKFHPFRLPEHETAYAMTVHKSQGSEFDKVCLLLSDRDSPVLTRELLYTGITRAKGAVEIGTTESVFRAAVSRRIERTSGLRDALWTP